MYQFTPSIINQCMRLDTEERVRDAERVTENRDTMIEYLTGGFEPKREDTLEKAPELYIVNKTILKSKDRVIDLPWKKEAGGENVARNVTNILGNTGPRQSTMSTNWLVDQIAKINRQIAEVDAAKDALVQARDHFLLLLSSQKGGDASVQGEETEGAQDSEVVAITEEVIDVVVQRE
ncbi:hypothetical protein K7X08_026222 [Anisodus acutangulus]|uniref:Uncharacterized protein n=1 Tax=Anisodus acutangulus TaxID=402998 RepID=A0A9Q1RUX9_9SOLA|nr:hypothetical protein K7X08_026222 [Anisodus acutangulus]